ncbi:MAG TPA: cytochrome c3 family protein [Candidatus Saccharimonadales bacterium]|nr:cytochrome c3 family protein [Candidatus Saccharimonadales bacterium]
MKRFVCLVAVGLVALFGVAAAGDYHVGLNLVCSDCHVMHASQQHGYSVGGGFTPLGAAAPYNNLLRNDPNDLCLTCHDNNSVAPDVFGGNTGKSYTGPNRLAGALNADPAHRSNDAGYDVSDGHTLWSTATAPGGTFSHATDGLECTDCHAAHGTATQYRNLLNRGSFSGKNVTYAVGTNDLTKDVFERFPRSYSEQDVDYNEPDPTKSSYGAWCSGCHTHFHGSGGSTDMGGVSGGVASQATPNTTPWLRHPTADVNIGNNTAATYISSLAQFNGHTNRVKVMDSQGLWNGTTADNTVTPSCFSCHKSHGDKNAFGLIFMAGTGTVTEEGDGGAYRDLCRQCHTEGS